MILLQYLLFQMEMVYINIHLIPRLGPRYFFFKFMDSVGSVCVSRKNMHSQVRKPKCQKWTLQICVEIIKYTLFQ